MSPKSPRTPGHLFGVVDQGPQRWKTRLPKSSRCSKICNANNKTSPNNSTPQRHRTRMFHRIQPSTGIDFACRAQHLSRYPAQAESNEWLVNFWYDFRHLRGGTRRGNFRPKYDSRLGLHWTRTVIYQCLYLYALVAAYGWPTAIASTNADGGEAEPLQPGITPVVQGAMTWMTACVAAAPIAAGQTSRPAATGAAAARPTSTGARTTMPKLGPLF